MGWASFNLQTCKPGAAADAAADDEGVVALRPTNATSRHACP
jgi:hypothetical protein